MWSSVFGVLCSCLHAWEKFPLRGGLSLALCVCVTERGIWWIMEQMWSVLGFSLSPSLGLALTLSSSLSLAAVFLSLFFHFYVRPSFLLFCSLLLPFSFDFPLLSCSSFHVFPLFPSVLLRRLMLSLKRASFAWALVTWCKIESRRRKGCINFCKSFRPLSVPHKAVSLLLFILLLSVWFT